MLVKNTWLFGVLHEAIFVFTLLSRYHGPQFQMYENYSGYLRILSIRETFLGG